MLIIQSFSLANIFLSAQYDRPYVIQKLFVSFSSGILQLVGWKDANKRATQINTVTFFQISIKKEYKSAVILYYQGSIPRRKVQDFPIRMWWWAAT